MTYPALIPKDRLFIFAGTGDRMSPPKQAIELWKHWNEPEIAWFDVNHMAFIWSGAINEFVRRSLAKILDQPRAA